MSRLEEHSRSPRQDLTSGLTAKYACTASSKLDYAEILEYQERKKRRNTARSQTTDTVSLRFADSQRPVEGHPAIDQVSFPAVYFLDSNVFQQDELEIPRPQLPIPSYVKNIIGDVNTMHEYAAEFFDSIHFWWPIISRRRFFKHLLNPLTSPRADVALLCLSIKISTWKPQDEHQSPRTVAYSAVKRYFLELEMQGVLTLQALQAGILICLYEVGHALYPSAYLTIGTCARYGISMGLDKIALLSFQHTSGWLEAEEMKRAWYVTLGNITRSLATPNPQASDTLPVDDNVWDEGGKFPPQTFPLSSSSTLYTGRFARLAQATYLLGLTLEHSSNHDPNQPSCIEEARQLCRTIRSLMWLIDVEGRLRNLPLCPTNALCYMSLYTLHCLYITQVDPTLRQDDNIEDLVGEIIEYGSTLAKAAISYEDDMSKIISPFILHLLYRSAALIFGTSYEPGKNFERLEEMKKGLFKMSKKWRLASSYLDILRAQEFSYYGIKSVS
ncbi:hypothetical protein B7463_g4904, partial [Scytalidium lignicola]